jgi:hypothetical protein
MRVCGASNRVGKRNARGVDSERSGVFLASSFQFRDWRTDRQASAAGDPGCCALR